MCVAVEFNKNEISSSEQLKHNFRIDGDFVRVSVLDSRPVLLIRAYGESLGFGVIQNFFTAKKSL